MTFYHWEKNDLFLKCHVIPGAKQFEILGPFDDHLKVKIPAKAQDNQANETLIRAMSRAFEVSKSRVTLIKGQHHRQKVLKIHAPQHKPAWISR